MNLPFIQYRTLRLFGIMTLMLLCCTVVSLAQEGFGEDKLILMLSDINTARRAYAARQLGDYSSQKSLESLISALADKYPIVRANAAYALGNLQDQRATDGLAQLLTDDSIEVSSTAAIALGLCCDSRATKPLIELLRKNLTESDKMALRNQISSPGNKSNSQKNIRPYIRKCMLALSRIGKPSIVEMNTLLKDLNIGMRMIAVIVLGNVQYPDSINPLLFALKDKDVSIKSYSAKLLGLKMDTRAVIPLIDMLNDPEKDVRTEAAISLGSIKDRRAIPALLNFMSINDAPLRSIAIEQIGLFYDSRALSKLNEALTDTDITVRTSSVMALSQYREKSVISPLKSIINDPNVSIRNYAIVGLSYTGDKSVVPIIDGCINDKDPSVRMYALRSLVRMKVDDVIEQLFTLIEDPTSEVGSWIHYDLSQYVDNAIDKVIALLQSNNSEVRLRAVKTLREMKDNKAIDSLAIALLNDEDDKVRSQSARALGVINDKKSVGVLCKALNDNVAEVRGNSAWALGQIRDPASLDSLRRILGDNDDHVRIEAIRSIGLLKDVGSVDALLVAGKDNSPLVRSEAIKALVQIGDNTAEKLFRESLGERYNSIRYASLIGLGALGNKENVKIVMPYLHSNDMDARNAAAEALAILDPKSLYRQVVILSKDPRPGMRISAIHAIRALHNADSIELLRQMMNSESNIEVLGVIIDEIGNMGDKSFFDALFIIASSETNVVLRLKALKALSETRDEKVGPLCAKLIHDDISIIRWLAAEVIISSGDMKLIQSMNDSINEDTDLRLRTINREQR